MLLSLLAAQYVLLAALSHPQLAALAPLPLFQPLPRNGLEMPLPAVLPHILLIALLFLPVAKGFALALLLSHLSIA
jgi:hypothetical protein